jgi:hypothetical protein
MSEQDPAIIQGDHPFKVEAVLSKTGGVNALAKRPKKMNKGPEILMHHPESVPAEDLQDSERVHINADLPCHDRSDGPLLQDQFDTQHREQFTDPTRRLTTNLRVKIQASDDIDASTRIAPPEDKSHLAPPLLPTPLIEKGSEPATTPSVSEEMKSAPSEPAPSLATANDAEAQEQRQQFLRRIEQIKNTNESVGKDLEALEKLTSMRPATKPGD